MEYIRLSLETNLFFLRIAKEHAIFAATSLPPRDAAVVNQLMMVKCNFERLLSATIALSQGMIRPVVLSSGELVTDLTLAAENKTQYLTGLPINTNLTMLEMALIQNRGFMPRADFKVRVTQLNQEIIRLLRFTIDLKNTILGSVLSCNSFSYTYPTMLHHVIEETELYLMLLEKIEDKDSPIDSVEEVIQFEINWNDIMGEHTKFIRGYLDPSEVELFKQANAFSDQFDELNEKTKALPQNPDQLPEITGESETLVTNLRDFKRQGTEGILACQVKSLIPPLLADHVTREANHYLRLLNSFKQIT